MVLEGQWDLKEKRLTVLSLQGLCGSLLVGPCRRGGVAHALLRLTPGLGNTWEHHNRAPSLLVRPSNRHHTAFSSSHGVDGFVSFKFLVARAHRWSSWWEGTRGLDHVAEDFVYLRQSDRFELLGRNEKDAQHRSGFQLSWHNGPWRLTI